MDQCAHKIATKFNNFKSYYPVRPGSLGLVNTADKMAEQQQMVLFIRQLLASLIRELENDNDQSGSFRQLCISH